MDRCKIDIEYFVGEVILDIFQFGALGKGLEILTRESNAHDVMVKAHSWQYYMAI